MGDKMISKEIITFLKEVGFNNPTLLDRITHATYTIVCEGSLTNQEHYTKQSEFNHHYEWLRKICNGVVTANMDLTIYIKFDGGDLEYEFIMNEGMVLNPNGWYCATAISEAYDDVDYHSMKMTNIVKSMCYELTDGDYAKYQKLKMLTTKL